MRIPVISVRFGIIWLCMSLWGCDDPESSTFDADQDADTNAETDPDGDTDEENCQPQDQLACNDDGDVIWLDSCGQPEDGIVEDCPDGSCSDGACRCEQGWFGEDCDQCLFFVNGATGNDENSGISWDQALATVNAGLEAARTSECDVWVAAGTYYPTDGTDREATFQLMHGVGLYGGFAGTESTLEERDIEANETILNGDIDRNDVSDEGNVYHVVTGVDDSTIDGFTITGGNANHSNFKSPFSGGGGMYNSGVSPTVRNCTFLRNNASSYGGGMYNGSTASPTVTNCSFFQNTAEQGAGMANIVYSSPTVTNCIFSENEATDDLAFGGGMYNGASSPIVANCIFTHNTANMGSGIANILSSSPTITNCVFSENEASPSCGVIANAASSPTITNCTITNNTAEGSAGGLCNGKSSSPTVTNCIFWGNTASSGEGQIHNTDEDSSTIVTYSNVQGGYDGEGNIDSDPLLDDSIRLSDGSPCIDAGDSSGVIDGATDLNGNPRIVDGDGNGSEIVDMGAYEFDPSL